MQIKCPVAIVECFDRHVDRTTKIIDGAWIVALHLKDPLPFFNSLLFHDGITSSKILSTIYCLICRRDLFDAYISRDFYMQVQEEMIRRVNFHSGAKRKKRVYSSKYALSSIVYCSKCGEIYQRIAWNNRGKHSTVWRCCTRVEHGPTTCDAPTI